MSACNIPVPCLLMAYYLTVFVHTMIGRYRIQYTLPMEKVVGCFRTVRSLDTLVPVVHIFFVSKSFSPI
jgi:hypothetical protein